LERHVTRTEKKSGGDGDDDDGSEMEDIHKELQSFVRGLYAVFDYYASYSIADDGESVFAISQLGFSQMLDDWDLDEPNSKACKLAHLDTIFIEVNSGTKSDGIKGGERSLSRNEFIELLARVAIAKHVVSGRVADVSEAFTMLIENDMKPKLVPMCQQGETKYDFLYTYCYTELLSDTLLSYRTSLLAIYNQYAIISPNPEQKVKKAFLSVTEWLMICEDLLPRADTIFSLRLRKLCFLRSRMRTIDETASRTRLTQLYFEDFLECLCRAAVYIPLPTNEELEESECENVWFFWRKLLETGSYNAFVDSHPPPGIDTIVEKTDDFMPCIIGRDGIPMWRRVEHLIVNAITTVEKKIAKGEDGKLTELEVAKYIAKRTGGKGK